MSQRLVAPLLLWVLVTAACSHPAPSRDGAVDSPSSVTTASSPVPRSTIAATAASATSPSQNTSAASGQQLSVLRPEQLPSERQAVVAMLARMPATVQGRPRTVTGQYEVSYGQAKMSVAPLAEAAGNGMSMKQFFETFTSSGQFSVAARSVSGSMLLWFEGDSTESQKPVAAVADENGAWLFGFEAPDGTQLDGLLTRRFHRRVPREAVA